MKNLIKPFGETTKSQRLMIVGFWVGLIFILFQFFHSPIIPSPTKIFASLFTMLKTKSFYEELLASLITTLKAMLYSIIATVIVVYASTVPVFTPIALFISKCRYLTLTGLVFVFTMLSDNLSDTKMYLLMFGIIPFFVTSFLSVIEQIPKEEKWKGYVNKLNRWETLYEVVIIGKLDMLFEVMRQNFAISWMMITMVEGFAMSDGGIGTLLIKSNKYLNLAPVFAILIVVFLLGLIFDWVLGQLRLFLFPYLNSN